jgi:hypothetical protein
LEKEEAKASFWKGESSACCFSLEQQYTPSVE